jgi:hypothetical protein
VVIHHQIAVQGLKVIGYLAGGGEGLFLGYGGRLGKTAELIFGVSSPNVAAGASRAK